MFSVYLEGLEGGQGVLKLPPIAEDWTCNSPTLFLTVADVMQEFFSSHHLRDEVSKVFN